MMRTTVTLDDDVLVLVRQRMHERGISFKEAVNSALRDGLTAPAPEPRRFRMPTSDMGLPRGVDLDKAGHFAAELEDAEILRKLALGK